MTFKEYKVLYDKIKVAHDLADRAALEKDLRKTIEDENKAAAAA